MARRFYGVMVSNVEPVISTRFPTAATNGKQHYWNPEFVTGLTTEETLGVQAHESEHDARHHGTRRGSRDPQKWNEACDFAINPDLIREGFKLPKGALLDWKYEGWSAEDIYRARELDEQRKQPEPPEADESDEPEQDEGNQPDDGDDKRGDEPGDDEPDEAGDEPGTDEDEGDEPGDEDGDDGQGSGEGADGDGEADGGESPGEGGDGAGEGSGGAGEGGEGEGEGSGSGEGGGGGQPGQGGSGDPGGCGEVLDTVADGEAGLAEEDQKWERITRQAVSMAKGVGQLPGHIAREIERANNPPRDWRDELREFCEQGGLRIETWNRPNRRFIGRGLVLPSTQKEGISKAAFLIDTSGSCDAVALALVQNEAQAMLDDGIIDEIVVVYGDTRVCRVDEYTTGDDIEFDPKGGGGTDMAPLFAHVADEHEDATLVVCFTDLEFYRDCGPEPHCPVLFAAHGYPQRVKQLMEKTPWNAKAIDVGAH